MSLSGARFINRELSWLEFNQRVLNEARDQNVPLAERLNFLAITASNLDEFFMVRVGGLQQLAAQGRQTVDAAGMTVEEQLKAIRARISAMTADQYDCYLNELQPQLAEAGIVRLSSAQLTTRQSSAANEVFNEQVFAILSPIAVRAPDEFPLLANRTLNVCVHLRPPPDTADAPRFAVLPLGEPLSRIVTLPTDGGYGFMLLEDLVAMFVDRFFPGVEVVECVPFRLTRDADLSVREDQAHDLLAEMEVVLDARKASPCVRLEVSQSVTSAMFRFLTESLDLAQAAIYPLPGPIDLSQLRPLTQLQGFDKLRYELWPPSASPEVEESKPVTETVARRDVLLYHPFDSFEPVQRLIEEAADDPDVLAIKQTLYRTSPNSPVVAALARAAENGKYVTAVVELKARFDEARNIQWARNLEHAGVHVIYGVKGLKTHAKVCIIVRREPQGIQRYVHFGTGNYNEVTARLYIDASLLTCDEELGRDAVNFFNAVTGYSQPQQFLKIDAAPLGLRERLLEMINAETENCRNGQRGRIMVKLNSLVDPQLIEALYAASQAGVEVKLNVRGICCLRPGVLAMSENITVVSIVDRFLEHSRILYFYHGGDERLFISSADWMPRNLDRRIELLVPVEDAHARRRLIAVLETCFRDTTKAHRLCPDGHYDRIAPRGRRRRLRSQEVLYHAARQRLRESQRRHLTTFEPHRAEAAG